MSADLITAMRLVQDDCKTDAERTEGMPLTGRNVGEMFGNVLAMIATVARAVEMLAEQQGNTDKEDGHAES